VDLQARPLQYFLAVARERSFSRAAERLNVSQPALSAQIRELERRLGFGLFDRSSRSVSLTREGRLFLDDARRTVAQSARLLRAADEIRRSELRIGTALYTALIPERVELTSEFHLAHPGIRMHIENLFQVDQYTALKAGELDLAIAIGLTMHSVPAADEMDSEIVFPPNLERMTLSQRSIKLQIPLNSRLANTEPLRLLDLKDQQVAMLGDFHGSELIDAISIPLLEAGAKLIVPPEGNAISVEQFGRVSSLPAIALGWFEYECDRSSFIVRPIADLDVRTDLALLRLHADEHRPSVDAFWNFAEKRRQFTTG